MAQQVFPQWSPVVRAHNEDQQEVYIPAAIIHAQTRDGKDELIVGAANMQLDPETGDYLPTHVGNPVEVRARALETLLQTLGKEETLALIKAALDALVSKDFATQTTLAAILTKLADLATESTLDGLKSAVDALAGTVDAGAQKVTLSGSIAQSLLQYHADLDEVLIPRAVRQAGNENIWLSPPDGAIGLFVYAKAYSVTGQFGSNQGFYLRLRRQPFNSTQSSDALLDYATEPHQSVQSGVSIAVFPGANEVLEGKHIKANHPLVGGRWRLGLYVSGAFGEDEGIDCEVRGHWVFK